MPVDRSLLELRNTPPREWTVARPERASGPYLVCPSCRHRASLPDRHVTAMRCPRCNDLFPIVWNDGSPEPSREQLRPDLRMTRRRVVRDRRNSAERRDAERRVIGWGPLPAERRLSERRMTVYRRSGWDRRGIVERRRRATTR
jgi:uncharacterized protein YbaR (Trm112 family)